MVYESGISESKRDMTDDTDDDHRANQTHVRDDLREDATVWRSERTRRGVLVLLAAAISSGLFFLYNILLGDGYGNGSYGEDSYGE